MISRGVVLRRHLLRDRIRFAIVATAAVSALSVSIVIYGVTAATCDTAVGNHDACPDVLSFALSVIVMILVIATLAFFVSKRIADGVAGTIVGLSLQARRIADEIAPDSRESLDSDKIEVLTSSFNRIASGLQDRIERERRFVAHASHEMRTPLAALGIAADVLVSRRNELSPSAAEAADLVVDRSRHLARLVVDLLELTDLDSGRARIHWEPVDLRALVEALMRRRGATAPIIGGPIVSYADKTRLERILGNFIDNSYEHADGRDIRVSIRARHDRVDVEVADRGPGISSEDIPHLFDSFFKTQTSRVRETGGVGMGLPIAYENARLLGATITVESEVGQGTTFALHLPMRDRPPA
jgi:two-component system, OmpR family, sensor histidine kinase MtrB